jgi:hypothetical protein
VPERRICVGGTVRLDLDACIMYPLSAGAIALAVHLWIAFGRRPPTGKRRGGRDEPYAGGPLALRAHRRGTIGA